MSESSERYRKVVSQFNQRVEAVPDIAWDNPSPCDGWVARDVVRHLVSWVPDFLRSYAGIELPAGPPVDQDPVGAWATLRDTIQATLKDPPTAGRSCGSPGGITTVEQAIDMFVTGDVLVHTWDLARATGLDESLATDEVCRLAAWMEPYDAALRASGYYGPRVEVGSAAVTRPGCWPSWGAGPRAPEAVAAPTEEAPATRPRRGGGGRGWPAPRAPGRGATA